MLEITGLSVTYGHGRDVLKAVREVSLTIPRGQTLGLVGESGSGKSTVARAIVGLAPVASGQIVFDGSDVSSSRARARRNFRRRVQMVFQDPHSSLNPRMTIGATLAEAVSMTGRTAAKARDARVVELVETVRLARTALDRYPHELSGGQRQRVGIARALASDPDVVLLDEVTSALDVSVQATILNLLKDLQQERGLSYLFIGHDLAAVGVMSDAIAVMYLGRVVEVARSSAIIGDSVHPYTRALIASVSHLGEAQSDGSGVRPLPGDPPDPRRPPSGCPFRDRCPVGPEVDPSRTICREVDPSRVTDERTHHAMCHFAGQGS